MLHSTIARRACRVTLRVGSQQAEGVNAVGWCWGGQVMRCADAGADMVRITVQGMKEADACHAIREELFRLRCDSLPSLPHLSAPLSKLTAE